MYAWGTQIVFEDNYYNQNTHKNESVLFRFVCWLQNDLCAFDSRERFQNKNIFLNFVLIYSSSLFVHFGKLHFQRSSAPILN